MRPCRLPRLALAALVAAAAAHSARGDPLDVLGFGPRAAAMGTAGLAEGEALEAAHGNPGAAGRGDGLSLALGWLAAVPVADLDGADADLDAAHGVLFGAAVPFELLGLRCGAALALHVPDRFVARIGLPGATEPRLLRWSDWLHRASASAVLSVEVGGGFSLGAGVTLLADAVAHGTIDLGTAEGRTWGTADVDLSMPLRAAPLAGLLFEPAPFLALGLTFRGALSMDVDINLQANADFADEALTGEARTRLRGTAYATPRTFAFGVTARWAGWTIDADVSWNSWSDLELPFADTATAIALGAPAPIVHRLFPRPAWVDTFIPAAGVEYEFEIADGHRLALRAGYAYEPSPVPSQTGLGNLADPDRHMISAGAGWRMQVVAADEESAPLAIFAGLAFQAHDLVPFRTEKEEPEFAGPALSAGGWVWATQLWAGVSL
jgi:hypothetical protein